MLIPPFCALVGTAIAASMAAGRAGTANPGAHGFSEILYAFSSAAGNNGSAFAGLSANTPFYNTALGIVMWVSRYWLIVPVLAIAGSLAAKKAVPASAGTLPTHTPLFVVLLAGDGDRSSAHWHFSRRWRSARSSKNCSSLGCIERHRHSALIRDRHDNRRPSPVRCSTRHWSRRRSATPSSSSRRGCSGATP